MKLNWNKKSLARTHSPEAKAKRKKSMTRVMEAKRKERGAWFCQNSNCGTKHYQNESKYVICQKCFNKLKGR